MDMENNKFESKDGGVYCSKCGTFLGSICKPFINENCSNNCFKEELTTHSKGDNIK